MVGSRRAIIITGASLYVLLCLTLLRRKKKTKAKYVTSLDAIGLRVEGNDIAVDAPEYDVVVVGGGTAGCVIASRLSENPEIRVLLLESGGSGQDQPSVHIPSAISALFYRADIVHQFYTVPQSGAAGREMFMPRARLLGGCSSTNAQVAQFGARGDFDEWASITGDESWAWNNLSRYFRTFESFQPHPEYPLVDKTVRGRVGPVQIGFFNTITLWCDVFIKACFAIGIPLNHDFNGVDLNPIGAGRCIVSYHSVAGLTAFLVAYVDTKHRRVTSESAYLTPEVLARKNLTVAVHATVTRVVTDASSGKPRAVGVEFANDENSPRFQVRAKKEVVVCGGAIHSPALLMLSGIGPAAHLKEKGIPVVCDLPGVGENLLDHAGVYVNFKQNGVVHSLSYFRPKNIWDKIKLFGAVARFRLNQGGPLASNFVESAAFVRSDNLLLFPKSEYPDELEDTTSGKDGPDLELFMVPSASKTYGRGYFDVDSYSICVYLLRPTSRGSIQLNSASAFDPPIINPQYLQTRDDVAKLVRGVRLALKIVQQEPLRSLTDLATLRDDFDHTLLRKSDSEVEAHIREQLRTIFHPTSTCKMAKREEGGVVDSQLRVYGVEGLRVCDASIFPMITSGHPAGACFAVAEMASDMIKNDFQKVVA